MSGNRLQIMKISGLVMIIGSTMSLTINLYEGKGIYILALNALVIFCGIFINLKDFTKK